MAGGSFGLQHGLGVLEVFLIQEGNVRGIVGDKCFRWVGWEEAEAG